MNYCTAPSTTFPFWCDNLQRDRRTQAVLGNPLLLDGVNGYTSTILTLVKLAFAATFWHHNAKQRFRRYRNLANNSGQKRPSSRARNKRGQRHEHGVLVALNKAVEAVRLVIHYRKCRMIYSRGQECRPFGLSTCAALSVCHARLRILEKQQTMTRRSRGGLLR